MNNSAFSLHRSAFCLPRSLVILPFVIFLAAVAAPAVVTTLHAVNRHGLVALEIHNCFNQGGPTQIWRDAVDPNLFYRACRLPDGRWGLQVVRWRESVRHWVERTAFVKGDGSEGALVRYLSQFAAKFYGALPH